MILLLIFLTAHAEVLDSPRLGVVLPSRIFVSMTPLYSLTITGVPWVAFSSCLCEIISYSHWSCYRFRGAFGITLVRLLFDEYSIKFYYYVIYLSVELLFCCILIIYFGSTFLWVFTRNVLLALTYIKLWSSIRTGVVLMNAWLSFLIWAEFWVTVASIFLSWVMVINCLIALLTFLSPSLREILSLSWDSFL